MQESLAQALREDGYAVDTADNAIKCNGPNGLVSVRCKQAGERIEVEIEDNGIGIPEAAISKLFDRFYRVSESRAREAGGTGLSDRFANTEKHLMNGHRYTIAFCDTIELNL